MSHKFKVTLIESDDGARFDCTNQASSAALVSLNTTQNLFKMSLYILGFVVALVLAALVVIWIAYCMFIRERHRSEFFHQNISDLQRRNDLLDQTVDEVPTKKEMAVGVFVLPSRHKQKNEDYDKRPDYPESPAHVSNRSTDKLIDILGDTADVHYKDGICEVDSHHPGCDSEV